MVLRTEQTRAPADFRSVDVALMVHGLPADETFQVWFADVHLDGAGRVDGCAALQIGTLQTNRAGAAVFTGTGTAYTGVHVFQVFVSVQHPFTTFAAFTTTPLEVTVP